MVKNDELDEDGEEIKSTPLKRYIKSKAKREYLMALKKEKQKYTQRYLNRVRGVTTASDGLYLLDYNNFCMEDENDFGPDHLYPLASTLRENHEIEVEILKKLNEGIFVSEKTLENVKNPDQIIEPDY